MPPMPKKKNHDRSVDKIGFSVALPKSLAAQIQAIAQGDFRTRNAQIEMFLTESVERYKKANAEPLGFVAEDREPPHYPVPLRPLAKK